MIVYSLISSSYHSSLYKFLFSLNTKKVQMRSSKVYILSKYQFFLWHGINFVCIFSAFLLEKKNVLRNISQNNVNFPKCFSYFKPKTSLFLKQTLKVIISVTAVAILLGFFMIFQPLSDKKIFPVFFSR